MVTNLSYATHIKQVAKMKATSSLNISWCSLGKEWNNLIWNSLLYLDVILFLPCTIFKMFTASVPVCATYCLFCFVFQVEGGKTNLRNCRPRNLWNRGKLRNLKKWLFFPGLIILQWSLNVIEDGCYFWGVHMKLSTRCNICSLLGCLQIIFFLLENHLAFPLKVTWMSSKVNWIVEYRFIVWFKLLIY